MKIVNVSETRATLEIADTGQLVAYGEEVEVEDAELAGAAPSGTQGKEGYDPGSGLLAQADVWAKPTTNRAKAAKEIAKEIAKELQAAEATESPEASETTSEEPANA